MKIMPLPQFEADADPERRSALTVAEQAARLQKPATIVVKYGDLGWVGEYAWEGDASPGCGSKILCKTHRGTEIGGGAARGRRSSSFVQERNSRQRTGGGIQYARGSTDEQGIPART